ncbi:MAG: DNA/RNA non-specific endonuclease [Bacteroidota bacterium]|nr:DNA/RNA non-specific endonuclease [Bacteroidota bacterium]
MKKRIVFSILILFATSLVFSAFKYLQNGDYAKSQLVKIDKNRIYKDYPKHDLDGQVVEYSGFTLKYVEKFEQSEWVMYLLTRNMVAETVAKRSNNFRPDPNISTYSATPADYKGSGYDKGHLCPAGDMRWSAQAMSETFFMSNMSPQKPAFNRGIWKHLEEKVREWATNNDSIVVISGPVLKDGLNTIGTKNKVSVPLLYYKVIADISYPTYKTIAFVMKNEGYDKSIYDFAVSVDSVEHLTGMDFFPNIKQMKPLEKSFDINLWK